MATLKANGIKLGEWLRTTDKIAFMSNGKILRNEGAGWKLWKRVKKGTDPRTFWEETKSALEEAEKASPARMAYRRLLHKWVPLKWRLLVDVTLQHLADDPDGACSEVRDLGLYLSFEEVNQLLEHRKAADEERKQHV